MSMSHERLLESNRYPDAAGETTELREVLSKIWARKRYVLGGVVISAMAALIAAKAMPPHYTAEAFILIKPPENARLAAATTVPVTQIVQNQRFVLSSRGLAISTIERLHLQHDPEFNPALRQPSLLVAVLRELSSKMEEIAVAARHTLNGEAAAASAPLPPAEPAPQPRPPSGLSTLVIKTFSKGLDVSVEPESSIIRVAFTSAHPLMAALVPNTLLQIYLDSLVKQKRLVLAQQQEGLNRVLPELRARMRASERALADYRQETGLTEDESPPLLTQKLATIYSQVAAVRERRVRLTAELSGNREAAFAPGTPEVASLAYLREQQATLSAKLAGVGTALGPNNPKMRELKRQLSSVEAAIHRIRSENANRVKAELSTTKATEAELMHTAERYARRLALTSGGDPKLASLMAKAEADRKTYAEYVARANDAESGSILAMEPDASIISAATVPLTPSLATGKIVLIGLLIGAGAGLILASLLDALLRGLRSKQQVEDLLGVKCLGLVPRIGHRRRKQLRAAELRQAVRSIPSAMPGSRLMAFGQAIRGVQLKLVASNQRGGPQVVLVTAALPQEGKTLMAVSLAASLAVEGFPVALIDCDLSRPAIHRMFDGARGPGLSDYFGGGARLDEIIHRDRNSGVDYIPVGSAQEDRVRFITADRLRPIIHQLEKKYAFIILDSAPVLAVSETTVLSQLAQKTIFVAKWGTTDRGVARYALSELLEANGSETAVVLSMVDVKRAARHGDQIAGVYRQLGKNYTG